MKTMKTYIQPATELIDLQTLDLCDGVAGSMYTFSGGHGAGASEGLSPTRWPVISTYVTRTLYI